MHAEKKTYYIGRYISELSDPAKAASVLNEILSDETLDIIQRTEIFKELGRLTTKDAH